MDPALADAMREVRQLGFTVGLHTAGMYTRRLIEVLPLVDWVGLDIKALAPDYDRITATPGSANAVWRSLHALLDSGVAFECRTTVHPNLHRAQDILTLVAQLRDMGVRHYALQTFRPLGCVSTELESNDSSACLLDTNQLAEVSNNFSRFDLRQMMTPT